MEYNAEIEKLKNLKPYKNKTDEELIDIVNEKSKENLFKPRWSGLSKSESKWAEQRFNSYKDNYHFDSLSDLQLLEDLVWRESIQERYKRKIQEIESSTDKANIVPTDILKALDSFQDKILELKEKLGLFREKKEEDFLSIWERLKQKIQKHAQTNASDFTFKCPECGKFALLVKKVSDYNTFKWSMFRGSYLYNEVLFKFIDNGKLTLEDVAEIWGQPLIDYVEHMYKDLYLIEKKLKERDNASGEDK